MRYMNEENFSQQELFEQEQYISDLIEKKENFYQMVGVQELLFLMTV